MKKKDVSKVLAVVSSLSVLAVYGCGGGGGDGGGTTGTTISNPTQAASAGASATQSASISSNVGQTLSGLAAGGGYAPKYRSPLAGKDPRLNKLHMAEARAMRVTAVKRAAFLKRAREVTERRADIPPETNSCDWIDANGNNIVDPGEQGSFTLSGTYDSGTSQYSLTIDFNNCRDGEELLDGIVTVSGTYSNMGSDSFTMKLGDGDGDLSGVSPDHVFRVELYDAPTSTTMFAHYIADMTMSVSGTADSTGENFTFTFTANGKEVCGSC